MADFASLTFETIQGLHSLSAGRGSAVAPFRPASSRWVYSAWDGVAAAFPQGAQPYGDVGVDLTTYQAGGVLWADMGVLLRRRPDRQFAHLRVDTYSGSAYYGFGVYYDARAATPKSVNVQGVTSAAATLAALLAEINADTDIAPRLQGARILTASGLLEVEWKIPTPCGNTVGLLDGGNALSANLSMIEEATVCAWRPWGRQSDGQWVPLSPAIITHAAAETRKFDVSGLSRVYVEVVFSNGPALPVAGPRLIDGGFDQAREDAATALSEAWGAYNANTPASTTLGELGSFPTDERGAWSTGRLVSDLDSSPTVAQVWGSTGKPWACGGLSSARVHANLLQGLSGVNVEVWGLHPVTGARLLAPSTALANRESVAFDLHGCTRAAALVFGWATTGSDRLAVLNFEPLS